jgi:hypothetical protein
VPASDEPAYRAGAAEVTMSSFLLSTIATSSPRSRSGTLNFVSVWWKSSMNASHSSVLGSPITSGDRVPEAELSGGEKREEEESRRQQKAHRRGQSRRSTAEAADPPGKGIEHHRNAPGHRRLSGSRLA